MLHWRVWLLLLLVLAIDSLRAQYVVASGDTLSGIARKTLGDGTRWREIAVLNQLREPYRLQVGQSLRLPQSTAPEPPEVVLSPSLATAPSSPIIPMVAETASTDVAEVVPIGPDEAEMVSRLLSEMIGRDLSIPDWMVSLRAAFFLMTAVLLLLYVPFWATGVMFTMFLFKQELSRWDALKTALSWGAIILASLLPISFISFDENSFERHLPWIVGLGIVAFLLALRSAKKFTGCSNLQSPFVLVFGLVFGCAALETLFYVVGMIVGMIVLIVLAFL